MEITQIYSHLTEQKFRQITYLVISLINMLVSRIFCQKGVTVNFRNFHTVRVTVWKLWNFSLTLFRQRFRESNGFTKQITKELI